MCSAAVYSERVCNFKLHLFVGACSITVPLSGQISILGAFIRACLGVFFLSAWNESVLMGSHLELLIE